jgi:hypothetical protein
MRFEKPSYHGREIAGGIAGALANLSASDVALISKHLPLEGGVLLRDEQ